jgi:hypothetical protein
MARSVQNRSKKARQAKSKVKSMFIIFHDIKRIVHIEFILAGQTINSAYYCDVLQRLHKNVGRLCPKLWRQKNWLLHQDNTQSHIFFFTSEFLTKDDMAVAPHPPYFSLVPH